jgi:NAD(P)-dependent dehydrogenase (short-subunit alcohol dehydrogenase family)
VDALVNSAFSVGELAVFPNADLRAWRGALEVNLFGALVLSRAVVEPMEQRGGGAIINVNTMSSRQVMLAQGAYGVSKAALTAATRQLAVELGPKGIRVNTVILGPMRGPNLASAMANWAQRRGVTLEEIEAEVGRNMALGRIPEDAECASAIALLLSDHARVITGAEITANAGAFLEARIGNAPPENSGASG